MMGNEFFPILGAELGDRRMIDAFLPAIWQAYLRPPFNVLAETPKNQNVNFITGAGAFLQQFLYGYSGRRLGEDGLMPAYPPLLPSAVKTLVISGAGRGARFRVDVPATAGGSSLP
jgi:hypothetical protein